MLSTVVTTIARLLALACLVLPSAAAFAQGGVLQAGPTAPGRAPMYTGQGSAQPVVQDSGPAGGGAVGRGLKELGITARGTGTPPYAGQGSGEFGSNFCMRDAPITNAAGYHYLCLDPNAQGGGLIAYGAGGAASQLPLNLIINGTTYQFPFALSGVVGPATSIVNDFACWNNTTGTLLKDCTPYTTANNWTLLQTFTGGISVLGTAALSGGATVPTRTAGDSTTNAASTAFVANAVANAQANISFAPQGRITLQSGVPVMTASVAAATAVYYTSDNGGRFVPIYNGTKIVEYPFCADATAGSCELTVGLGPNFTANTNYDGFVGLNGTTVTYCFGPAWFSDSARGTGAGTTELEAFEGLQTNKVAITCRYANASTFTCAAHQCTYVGTVRTGLAGQLNYIFGQVGPSGVAGNFGIWNMYNGVNVCTMVGDTTDTWTYGVANTWRAANGSAAARVSAVRGFDRDGVTARYHAVGFAGAATVMSAGVGLNSTTAFSGSTQYTNVTASIVPMTAAYSGLMGLGYVFVAAIEFNSTATASTWVGDAGVAFVQTGFHVCLVQ